MKKTIAIFFNNDLVVQNIHLHRLNLSVSDRSAAVGIVMSAFQRKKKKKRNNNAIIIYTCILAYSVYDVQMQSTNASPLFRYAFHGQVRESILYSIY